MTRFHARGACFVALAALSSTLLMAPDVVADQPVADQGDDLTIYALTFGPGDHPFFKFGHNAILVQPKNSQGLVYNFGTFAFDSPALIPKFLRGKFMYWLSVSGAQESLEYYVGANRSILAQELNLTSAQRLDLWRSLRVNAQPENREYLYDYFYDNCSTRVRDAIDRAVEGRVRAAGQSPVSRTFRDHAVRMTADLWPEAAGINLGLGRSADIPLNRWDESFLPERLADLLRQVRLPDPGGEKNLVKSERVMHQDVRDAKPALPPNWTAYFLLVGAGLGGLLFGLGRLGEKTIPRVLLGCAASLVGLTFGLIGLALVLLWAFTNHKIAHANANIIQFAPWSLVLSGYGLGVVLGWPSAIKTARKLAWSAAVFSLLGIVFKVLPGVSQSNWPFIFLCLPIWIGLWAGLRGLSRTRPPTHHQNG